MKKTIDCLIIGHNQVNFKEYENNMVKMGVNSGTYRDLNLNYIYVNNKPYTAAEIFNLLKNPQRFDKNLTLGDTFSAAIAYLGSYLDKNGLSFDFVNSFQDEKAKLAEKLKHDNILTIAITTTLYVSVIPILEIINFIKKHNQPAKIIIGGPFISTQVRTLNPESLEYLFKSTIGADFYVISSQGEAALVTIIHALKSNLPLDRINNIYYKTDGGYLSTPILIEDNRLSENMVNWNLFTGRLKDLVNVRTSISCPFKCAFCGFPEHAGKYQAVEVERIEEELNLLVQTSQVKSVNFIDDTFNFPTSRFKAILKMLIKNNYSFNWHSYFRCQYADREMVQLMKESGCQGVFLGLESGSNQILKNMNKASQIDEYLRGVALLKEYGLVTHGNFIIGFPGETDETVRETTRFIENSGLDFYRCQLWYCEPITPIWKKREKYKIKGESFEWTHATMDWRTACDQIDEMVLTIKESTWLPQYNFDLENVWHLMNRGMGMEEIKKFLKGFNRGIREKLENSIPKDASYDVIRQLSQACNGSDFLEVSPDKEKKLFDNYDVGFNFQ